MTTGFEVGLDEEFIYGVEHPSWQFECSREGGIEQSRFSIGSQKSAEPTAVTISAHRADSACPLQTERGLYGGGSFIIGKKR